jgi:hypothetical protein
VALGSSEKTRPMMMAFFLQLREWGVCRGCVSGLCPFDRTGLCGEPLVQALQLNPHLDPTPIEPEFDRAIIFNCRRVIFMLTTLCLA